MGGACEGGRVSGSTDKWETVELVNLRLVSWKGRGDVVTCSIKKKDQLRESFNTYMRGY